MKLVILFLIFLNQANLITLVKYDVACDSDLSKAIKYAVPGDTINLADGIYSKLTVII
jgi:hypothetical protein